MSGHGPLLHHYNGISMVTPISVFLLPINFEKVAKTLFKARVSMFS
jgi:hypothetical protein